MKRLQVFCLSLLVAVAAMADITVKGTVTDAETGEALIGVSILVKGTTNGTVSDFDGAYELTVPESSIIQFSYMGYKAVEQAAQAHLSVKMETESTMLNEVVSLGYSSQKKAELSSSVVTVDKEKLTDVTTNDLGQMLQGKVAGLQVSNASGQPGEAAEMRIRGAGSITASSSPVYVVDGVMGASFNPQDVETITVLKDAGSTGIYGAAAAGGVIVVTTKSGKKNQKLEVDIKATAGAKQALFGNFVTMDGQELYDLHKSMYSKTAFNIKYPKEYKLNERNYDWRGELLQTGVVQDYYVGIRGGSDKVSYYAGLNYYDEKGTMKTTGTKNFSGDFKMNAQLTKWLDMEVRGNIAQQSTSYPSTWTLWDDAFNKMPWDNPYKVDANGKNTSEYLYVENDKRSDNGEPWWSQSQWNSLYNTQYDYATGKNFSFNGTLQFAIHFTDWLHFTTTNTYGASQYKSVEYSDPRTSASSATIKGSLSESVGLGQSFGTINILKGGYTWGDHSFNAMAGFEYSKWQSEYTSATGVSMPNGVDALNSTSPYAVGGYKVPGASWATFLQAQYDYAKRYFITATFRAEASSIFAPENRVGYFPSVAASWLISNERWMQNQNVVSFLKLRASYGVTGNNNIPEYKYLSTYTLTQLYMDKVAAAPSRLANPQLHWETANMATVGIDLTFIDRVDMSIDLYNTDNTGLLLNVPVAPSTGFYEVMKNAGTVRNQGIEYRLDANVLRMGKWNWNIGFNIAFNRNRVTELPDHKEFMQSENSVDQVVREGYDIYSWYMKEWAGVDPANGDPLWYVVDENENYVLDANGNKTTTNDYNATNAKIVGKATPIFQGGLNTQLSWNGIFLTINTNFNYGGQIFNYTRVPLDADGAYLGYTQLSIKNNKLGWSRWEKPGDVATHPKAQLNGNKNSNAISSRYLEHGSYFRLKNLTVGYDFPKSLIEKAKMTKLRIYFSADNLATISKFSGMDPEITMTSSPGSLAGMYSQNYPVGRSFLGGIEINF